MGEQEGETVRRRDERKRDKRGKAPQSTSDPNTREEHRNRETERDREQEGGEEARLKIEKGNLPPAAATAAAARRLHGGPSSLHTHPIHPCILCSTHPPILPSFLYTLLPIICSLCAFEFTHLSFPFRLLSSLPLLSP